MSQTAIKVENLSKQYRLGTRAEGYRTFRETLVDAAKAPMLQLNKVLKKGDRPSVDNGRKSSSRNNTIWALKDVSFEVKEGEVVGIIGRNGAGKSTLLKILSKITEPTEGRVELRGRIGSLLEVGTGFHPELTGHENIYLYGAILGMNRWEVTRKFAEIVAFAELERFIDTPVKRYSSGMYMRLAFAVAAHLEPEILLVDEVLAVGDAAFQKKCLGKMGDVSREGRTVLFVSHNMAAILALCQRALLLDSGLVMVDTLADKAVDTYLHRIKHISSIPLSERSDRKGNQRLVFLGYQITDSSMDPLSCVSSGQDFIIAIRYKSHDGDSLRNVHVAIGVHGRFDENLFHLSTSLVGKDFDEIPPAGTICCMVKRLPLQPGQYSFNLFCKSSGEIADWLQNAGTIDVEAGDFFDSGKLPPVDQGLFMVQHTWKVAPE